MVIEPILKSVQKMFSKLPRLKVEKPLTFCLKSGILLVEIEVSRKAGVSPPISRVRNCKAGVSPPTTRVRDCNAGVPPPISQVRDCKDKRRG